MADRLPVNYEFIQHKRVAGEILAGPLAAVFDESTEKYQSLMEWLRKQETLP